MRGEKGSERGRVVLCKLWRRDRQRTCARRALNCGIVEATTGKTRGHQVPKRPNTPYKTKHYKGWDGLGPQIEFGWAQQDVTKPQRSWVGVGRDAVEALGRLPWVGHRERWSSSTPPQRQTIDRGSLAFAAFGVRHTLTHAAVGNISGLVGTPRGGVGMGYERARASMPSEVAATQGAHLGRAVRLDDYMQQY